MDNHDKVMIQVTPSQISYWMDQMDTIAAFFETRDAMNSHVHLAEVRWSPITVVAQQIREEMGQMWIDCTKALAKQ